MDSVRSFCFRQTVIRVFFKEFLEWRYLDKVCVFNIFQRIRNDIEIGSSKRVLRQRDIDMIQMFLEFYVIFMIFQVGFFLRVQELKQYRILFGVYIFKKCVRKL